ncbi:MAG: hypothetical protein WAV86_15785 [Lutibacter sp.]
MHNRLVQISSLVFSLSVTYLIPIIAIFWGLLDGEKISFLQFFSGFVILVGITGQYSQIKNGSIS